MARIDSRGGTAMRDAIDVSIDHLKKKGKLDKKVIVVVTDGNDNASEITLEKLVQKAQQREVLIYTIGLLNEEEPREAKRAKRALDAITTATGGQSFYPSQVEDVGRFTLRWPTKSATSTRWRTRPLNQTLDGAFRQIKVTVNAASRPQVRTRTGYYATPELAKTSQARPAAAQAGPG